MFSVIKFFACLAILQFSHALIIVAIEPAWENRAGVIIAAAIIVDAVVVLALLT